ncbi:MAG: hypothetical protein IT537_17805 [Hyphomicrobiales bacterium]|nr:hypothetical protein [Hyphomicrobiales bacterium]
MAARSSSPTARSRIGLYLVSEVLSTKGVSVAGMLPAELRSFIVYNGAVLAGSKLVEPAGAFLRFLTEPGQRPSWQASGFEALGK